MSVESFEERKGQFYEFTSFVARRAEQYAKVIGIWPMGGKCLVSEWFSFDESREIVYMDLNWVSCDVDATRGELFAFEMPFYVLTEDSWTDRALKDVAESTGYSTPPVVRRDLLSRHVYEKLHKKFGELRTTTASKYSDSWDVDLGFKSENGQRKWVIALFKPGTLDGPMAESFYCLNGVLWDLLAKLGEVQP